MPKIVEPEILYPRPPHGRREGRVVILHRPPGVSEHGAGGFRVQARQHVLGPIRQAHGTILAVLDVDERHPVSVQIDVAPVELKQLEAPPAGIDGERDQRPNVRGRRQKQPPLFGDA